MENDDFQEKYRQLQGQFLRGLTGRERELRQATDLMEAHAVLHRLAGAAGAYGFGELGVEARELMDRIEKGHPSAAEQLDAFCRSLLVMSCRDSNDTI